MNVILSKILWPCVTPGNFLLVLLLIGMVLQAISSRADLCAIGKKICWSVAVVFLLIAVFPFGDWLLIPLEYHYSAEDLDHVDGIIVLGGGETSSSNEGHPRSFMHHSAGRYLTFIQLAHKYPKAILVFSGGTGALTKPGETTEADIARQNFVAAGISENRVVYEDKARNTRQNAIFSAALVHPTPQQNWLLVTSAWHMPRAIGSFRAIGWNVIPYPTDYVSEKSGNSFFVLNFEEGLNKLTLALHEYYGLLAYRLVHNTNRLWPV